MEKDEVISLLPQRPRPTKENAFQRRVKLCTNHHTILISQTKNIYQYDVTSQPQIPDDSIALLDKLVGKSKQRLKALNENHRILSYKGRMVYSNKPIENVLLVHVQYNSVKYTLAFKQVKALMENDINNLKGDQLKLFLHIYRTAIYQNLLKIGLCQVKRGQYFLQKDMGNKENYDKQINLQMLRTYQFRLVPLMKEISLQVDVSTRILRIENFLQTLSAAKSMDEKRQFIGRSVTCGYGKNMSYKITDIRFDLNPSSTFHQEKINGQLSYQKYYQTRYGIKIVAKNQPLIQVVTKIEKIKQKGGQIIKKQTKAFLIPELVRLSGLSQKQKNSKEIMKVVANFTKMTPDKRFQLKNEMIKAFNQKSGNDKIGKSIDVNGFIMPQTTYITQHQKRAINGEMKIKEKLKQSMKLNKKNWCMVYSCKKNDDQAQNDFADFFLDKMNETQKHFGIKVQDPVFILVDRQKGKSIDLWKSTIEKQVSKDDKIILFLLQRYQESLYGELKRFCTNKLKIPSQFVIKSNVNSQRKGLDSIITKIVWQMNAKTGLALWSIVPKHPYWKNKIIIYGALSISTNKRQNNSTLGFNGTYSRDLTKVFSSLKTGLNRDKNKIDTKVFQDLFVQWLKKYFENNPKEDPDVLILYREGLSDRQAQIQCKKQIQALKKCIERACKKHPNFNPQIVYIIVNKRINNRFFSYQREGSPKFSPSLDNPESGTIIFEELSCENSYDFHLVAQKVTQGTCNPTHYRIAFDSSKIPQEAIAQFTYEQCFNYYNWVGAVRVPSCLQNADKLARLFGQHIHQSLESSRLQQVPFFL